MTTDLSDVPMSDAAGYRLERLNEENADEWEAFNESSAEGSFFHSLAWKRIAEKEAGIRRHYFMLYKNEEVFGLFPFIEHNVHFFRGLSPVDDPHRLRAILKDYSDPSALQSVVTELRRTGAAGKRLSFIRCSASHEEILDQIRSYTLFRLPDIGDMVLDLSESPPEKVWDSFSAKRGQRKFIRRFEENGFSIAEAETTEELKLFYKYYEDNINHIGGKLQPFARLAGLWDAMPDETRITVLSKGSVVAGGMYMILDKPRGVVYTTYLSLNRDLPNTYHPSYYLWWEAMNWAWEHHYQKVSFGAQRLDEKNPRYRVKYDLGARYQPMYSRMISMTKMFDMGVKWGRWRSDRRSPDPTD